jgi:NADH dehydrogenase [ubiquinone] 1 alpha subcomplex assembly factor 1
MNIVLVAAMVLQVTLLTIFDFSDVEEVGVWSVTNDYVMGGISQGDWYQEDDYVVFEGDVSLENNGGFSSARVWFRSVNLSAYDGVALQVRGDGQTYGFGFRDMTSRYDYRVKFETTPSEEDDWETIYIPFDEAVATWFGRVFASAGQVNTEQMRGMNLIISDGQEGPFRLEIQSIALYTELESE